MKLNRMQSTGVLALMILIVFIVILSAETTSLAVYDASPPVKVKILPTKEVETESNEDAPVDFNRFMIVGYVEHIMTIEIDGVKMAAAVVTKRGNTEAERVTNFCLIPDERDQSMFETAFIAERMVNTFAVAHAELPPDFQSWSAPAYIVSECRASIYGGWHFDH